MPDIFGSTAADIVAYIGLKGVDDVNKGVDTVGGKFTSMGKNIIGVNLALGAMTAAFGLIKESVQTAAELERGMANVNTVLRLTPPELEKIKSQLLDVASETTQDINTLSEGLYDLASSGVSASDAQQALALAAKAATAGVTSVDIAVKSGMAVINAYGLDVKELSGIYDLQFKTVEKGVLTYEEYSRAIGNVLPSAASLGVSFTDLSASIAQITLAGIDAQSATTYLARAFDEMVSKRDKWEDLGVAIFDASGNFRGMEAVIGDLSKQMDGLTVEQQKMKLETLDMREQGGKAILALVNNYGSFRDVLHETKDAQNAMASAFDIQMKTFDAQTKLLKNEYNIAMSQLGNIILPKVTESLGWFNKTIKEYNQAKELNQIADDIVRLSKIASGEYINPEKAQQTFGSAAKSAKEYSDAISYLNRNIGVIGKSPIIPDAVVNIEKITKASKGSAEEVKTLSINIADFHNEIPPIDGPLPMYSEVMTELSGGIRGVRQQTVLVTTETAKAGDQAKKSSKDWADYASYIGQLTSKISGGNAVVGDLVKIASTLASGAFDPLTLGLQGIGFAVDVLSGENSVKLAGHRLEEMTTTLRDMYQPTMDAAHALELLGSNFKSDRLDSLKQQQTLYTQLIDQMSRTSGIGAEMAWAKWGGELEKVNAEIESLTGAFTEKEKLEAISGNMDYLLTNTKEMMENFGNIDNPGLITLLTDAIRESENFSNTLDPTSKAFTTIADQIQKARDLLLELSNIDTTNIPVVMSPTAAVTPGQTATLHGGGFPVAHDGYLAPDETLVKMLRNEMVLRPAATAKFGASRLIEFNATLDPSALTQNGGPRYSRGESPVIVEVHEATPSTWAKISDRHIQPRINTRTRKYEVRENPYAN